MVPFGIVAAEEVVPGLVPWVDWIHNNLVGPYYLVDNQSLCHPRKEQQAEESLSLAAVGEVAQRRMERVGHRNSLCLDCTPAGFRTKTVLAGLGSCMGHIPGFEGVAASERDILFLEVQRPLVAMVVAEPG